MVFSIGCRPPCYNMNEAHYKIRWLATSIVVKVQRDLNIEASPVVASLRLGAHFRRGTLKGFTICTPSLGERLQDSSNEPAISHSASRRSGWNHTIQD